MIEGRPSRTATWVAFDRAIASIGEGAIISDPIAKRLVPPLHGFVLRAFARFARFTSFLKQVLFLVSGGRSRHIELRTRAIDDVVREVATAGVRQMVLVGAGLDSRAYRLPELRDVVVYEVDHPSTQGYKHARVLGLPRMARDVRFVAVDFERESLSDRLAAAGQDAAQASVFVWEGVTNYLSREAIERTLSMIAAHSAPGTSLVMSYWEPPSGWPIRVFLAVLRWVSEPVRATFRRERAAELLARFGFVTVDDAGTPEWAMRYYGRPQRWTPERVIWAKKAP